MLRALSLPPDAGARAYRKSRRSACAYHLHEMLHPRVVRALPVQPGTAGAGGVLSQWLQYGVAPKTAVKWLNQGEQIETPEHFEHLPAKFYFPNVVAALDR